MRGEEPCGREIKLACKRTLDMVAKAESGKASYYFSPDHVVDVCAFIEELPHTEEGMWEVPTFVLEPHIVWQFTHIYGFRRRRNHERLVERAYIEEPRKNWKTGRAAAVCLYELTNSGQTSPQVLIAAASDKQGDRVYRPIRTWIDGMPEGRGDQIDIINEIAHELREFYQLETTNMQLRCRMNGGFVQRVSSIGEREDGWNPTLVCLEELHAQDPDVYEVLRSAAGAKPNSLMYMITTAGRMAQGLAYRVRKEMLDVLEGRYEDDTLFAAIYTLSEDEEKLLKDADIKPARLIRLLKLTNPMWDVSIDPEKILSKWREALKQPHQYAEFLRTTFNLWGRAARAMVKPETWDSCGNKDLKLEEMIESDLWLGIDLSSRNDMTALGFLFEFGPKAKRKLAVFAEYWIPEICDAWDHPRLSPLYKQWYDAGRITLCPGSMVDFNMIEARVLEIRRLGFRVKAVVGDDYQANQMITNLIAERIPAMTFKKTALNSTAATDDLMSRIPGKLLLHDCNPVLGWNFQNVVAYRDTKGGIVPKKVDKDSDEKIDGFDAVMEANAARLGIIDPKEKRLRSVYADRGLIGFAGED